jgi:hypothetical protein
MQSGRLSRSRLITLCLALTSLGAPNWDTRVLRADDSTQSQLVEPRLFVGDIRELPTILPCGTTDLACESSVLEPSEVSNTPAGFGQGASISKRASTSAALTGITTFPNFAGQQAALMDPVAAPPDTVGDVGPNHYIQAVNYDVMSPGCMNPHGTAIVIYDKSGTPVAGPMALSSMWTGTCTSCPPPPTPPPCSCRVADGDPIVLYDQLAQRWLLAEFASTLGQLCVYVSRTSNPVTGGVPARAVRVRLSRIELGSFVGRS